VAITYVALAVGTLPMRGAVMRGETKNSTLSPFFDTLTFGNLDFDIFTQPRQICIISSIILWIFLDFDSVFCRIISIDFLRPISKLFFFVAATGASEERQPAATRRERGAHQGHLQAVKVIRKNRIIREETGSSGGKPDLPGKTGFSGKKEKTEIRPPEMEIRNKSFQRKKSRIDPPLFLLSLIVTYL
jgi:hypothetical protein